MSVNRLGKGLEALIRPEAEQKKKPGKNLENAQEKMEEELDEVKKKNK